MSTTSTTKTIRVRAADAQPGDMAHRRNSELDARPVVSNAIYGSGRGRQRRITLQIGTLVTEPIPASLYTFTREVSA